MLPIPISNKRNGLQLQDLTSVQRHTTRLMVGVELQFLSVVNTASTRRIAGSGVSL
jgi:hypothetical protein